MASPCKKQQCTIDRRGFRQELDSWRHKLIHCVGFESILEGLISPRLIESLKVFKDSKPVAVSDWSFDENCLFCCLRRDKVKDHLIGLNKGLDEKRLLVKDQLTIIRLEKQAEEFLSAVLCRKDVPNFSDPHIPVVAREILQRMISQFAAEYTSKTSSPQDSRSDSPPHSDQSLPAPRSLSGAPPMIPAAPLAGPAHNQNPVLCKLLMADQDAPLDLTIKKPPAEPAEQDGVLDLSIKKSRHSNSSLPGHSPCFSPATSTPKGGSPDHRVAKAKDLQSTATLEQLMAKLCPHHQRQIVDAIGFLQMEVKAHASCNTQKASNSTTGNQGTVGSSENSSRDVPEKPLPELKHPSESTPKAEAKELPYSIPSSCTLKKIPEKAVSLKTSVNDDSALDIFNLGAGNAQHLTTPLANLVDGENDCSGDHAPLKLKIMTSNIAAGKKLSCVFNTAFSSHSETFENKQPSTNSSNRGETHSARLSTSVKRHNQASLTHEARHREVLGHPKDTPAKVFPVHLTIPSDSGRTARKGRRMSGEHGIRDSVCREMVDPDLGNCDIVFIDKPITECFKKQRRNVLPRRNARKSTRGHMYSDEIWELKTVRTLAGRGNCPNPMPELITLVTPKQMLARPEGVPPVYMPFAGACTETMNQQMPTEESDESLILGAGDVVEVASGKVDMVVEMSQTDQCQNKGQSSPATPVELPAENQENLADAFAEQEKAAGLETMVQSEERVVPSPHDEATKEIELEPQKVIDHSTEQTSLEIEVKPVESDSIEEAEPQLLSDKLPNSELDPQQNNTSPSPVHQIEQVMEEVKDENILNVQHEEIPSETQIQHDSVEVTEKLINTGSVEEKLMNTGPAEEKFINTDPTEKKLTNTGPVEEKLINTHPMEEKLTNTGPAEEKLINTDPMEEKLKNTGPAEEKLINPGPAEEKLKNTGPAEEKFMNTGPAEEKLMNTGPAEEKLMNTGPAEEKLMNTGPAEEKLMNTGPAEEKLMNTGPAEKPIVEQSEVETPEAVDNSLLAETRNNNDNASTKTLDSPLKESTPSRRKKGTKSLLSTSLNQTETVIVGYVNGKPVSASDRSLRHRVGSNTISPSKTPVKSSQNVPNDTSQALAVELPVENKEIGNPSPETHMPPETQQVTNQSPDTSSIPASKSPLKDNNIICQKNVQKNSFSVPPEQPPDQAQNATPKRPLRSASQKPFVAPVLPPTSDLITSICSPNPSTLILPPAEQLPPLLLPYTLAVTTSSLKRSSEPSGSEKPQQKTVSEPVDSNNKKAPLTEVVSEDIQKTETPRGSETKQKLRSAKAVIDSSKNEKQQLSEGESKSLENMCPFKTELEKEPVLVKGKRGLRRNGDVVDEALVPKKKIPSLVDGYAGGDSNDASVSDKPTRMPLRSETIKAEMSHPSVSQSPPADKKLALRSQRFTALSASAPTETSKQNNVASPVRIMPERISKAQVKPNSLSVTSVSHNTNLPVVVPKQEPPKPTTNKFFETLTGEASQHLITNLNNKYDKLLKGWVQMDKEGQPTAKYKNKSDRQAAIWKSKRRARKSKSSEHQKYSPVQMLFMNGFNLTSICHWFLESTETKSLVIVKKVNTRLPSETQLCFHSSAGSSGPSQGVFPSLQAERLKKHLKKFAIASPVKSNPKSLKLIAKALEQEANAVKGKEKAEVPSNTQTLSKSAASAKACAQKRESKKSSGNKNPASARILRKYSNIREKMQVQQTTVRLKGAAKMLKNKKIKTLAATKSAKSNLKPSLKGRKPAVPISKQMKESAAKLQGRKIFAGKKSTKRFVQKKAGKAQVSKAPKTTSKKELPKRSSQRLGPPKTSEQNSADASKSKANSKKQNEADKAELEKCEGNKGSSAKSQPKDSSQSVAAESKSCENAAEGKPQSAEVKSPALPDQVLTRSQRKLEATAPPSGSPGHATKRAAKPTSSHSASPKVVKEAEEPKLTRSGALKRSQTTSLPRSVMKGTAKRAQEPIETPAKRTRTK